MKTCIYVAEFHDGSVSAAYDDQLRSLIAEWILECAGLPLAIVLSEAAALQWDHYLTQQGSAGYAGGDASVGFRQAGAAYSQADVEEFIFKAALDDQPRVSYYTIRILRA